MGLSNMLSKLFKKENADVAVQIPVKFKDFDSIIVPPEPKTRPIFIYKTLDLGLEFTPDKSPETAQAAENSSGSEEEEVLLTDDMTEEITKED